MMELYVLYKRVRGTDPWQNIRLAVNPVFEGLFAVVPPHFPFIQIMQLPLGDHFQC